MKNAIKLFIVLAIALSFMGCTHKGLDYRRHSVEITASIGTQTRASGVNWNADAIGVIVTSSSSSIYSLYQNAHYTTTSTGTTATFDAYDTDNTIYFSDPTETVTFAAYAPYSTSSDAATLPGTSGSISGNTAEQTTTTAQEAIDYIYATGASASESNPVVNFTGDYAFKHVMSKLVINVIAGSGQSLSNIQGGTYTLGGLVHSGTFDVTTGTAAADTDTDASSWTLGSALPTYESYTPSGATDPTGITYTGYIYPQTVTALTFAATVNEESFSATLDTSTLTNGFEGGYYYTITVTISENSANIGGEDTTNGTNGNTIDDWQDGGTLGGTITGTITGGSN